MKKRLFTKSKNKFEKEEPVPDPNKSSDWLDQLNVTGLVREPLTTDHSNMESIPATIEFWKGLSKPDQNILLVEFRLPKKLIESQFEYFTEKQKSLALEFQTVPLKLIKKHWKQFDINDQAKVLVWQKLTVKFIDSIWNTWNKQLQLFCIQNQNYLERKDRKDLVPFLTSTVPEIRMYAKQVFERRKENK